MNRWIGKVALVTGASTGIGEAIAEKLAETGIKVVGVARRKDKLEEIATKLSSKNGKFFPCPGDVSKEEDIINAFKWAKENVGPVSILINNAGITRNAPLSTSATSNWVDILNVNVVAPCIAAREAIKHMKESNIDGHIIHLNSVAGHKVIKYPNGNMYIASKHAITTLSESLRFELASMGSKIKVTSLSPGYVRTEMTSSDLEKMKKMSPDLAARYKNLPILEVEDIANGALYILSTPKHVQISELTIQPVGERA